MVSCLNEKKPFLRDKLKKLKRPGNSDWIRRIFLLHLRKPKPADLEKTPGTKATAMSSTSKMVPKAKEEMVAHQT
jgi:hypothetical protein